MNPDTATYTTEYLDFNGTRIPWDNIFDVDNLKRCAKYIQGGILLADFKDEVLQEWFIVIGDMK